MTTAGYTQMEGREKKGEEKARSKTGGTKVADYGPGGAEPIHTTRRKTFDSRLF